MIVTAILALMPLFTPDVPPKMIRGMASQEECSILADKLNRTDEDLRKPEARVDGLEYVCLKVSRSRV